MHRHAYRGERWYVIEDRISRRVHRFSPAVYYVIGLMNGRRSMQEIWEAVAARLGEDAPSQDEIVQLLGQLHLADVMQCEVAPDVDDLLRRSQRLRQRNLLAKAPHALPTFDLIAALVLSTLRGLRDGLLGRPVPLDRLGLR